ncbi:MAG: indole-3-glycerol phosphate synthase TrpC [Nitrospirae bacterium]|nr:indole-3-glycerol phosphate synthase TrpC [Nitrospirota bacterium]MCL5977924.1 indole-3-glycerol phosphate synthase TrpC [Nitrospirota bacterium]
MNILTKIIDKKAERLSYAKSAVPIHELKKHMTDMEGARNFKKAVTGGGKIRLIAEIKKASPSKGIIRKDFDPVRIAAVYEEKPVSAVSVLTEEDFFHGHLSYIKTVKEITSKPVLRKDFVFDEYQIYESRMNHADAILLIAAALEKNQAQEYLHLAKEIGLHVLFEVHDEDDLEKALSIDADIIGINNRNLRTLKIDLSTTFTLKKEIPKDKIVVSESGIKNRDDVIRLLDAGIDAMLIGTSLMEAEDIGKKIDELIEDR